MSSQSEPRSPFVRFLDAFLQEDNIKWVLGIGVCLLLGSSLRLVTMHWSECTPVWKYLILIGYTGAVYGVGWFGYFHLGLKKTGTVLLALTVLLIPISFLALHLVRAKDPDADIGWWHSAGLTIVMTLNLAWSTWASQRIFKHFLRRTEPTFLISYLFLCLAGAVVPGLPTAWAPILSLFLWAMFAAGTVKVNRHMFWLVEEHRLPRICGFFPIALLGVQFSTVFALGLVQELTAPWLGLLCALVALPILMTADAVARVFEQRTGRLVRPIPWSISGPIFLGTVLCSGGVVLALTAWPANPMVVPTAVIAAVAFGVVAHRTQKSAFAWGMLVCVMLAYQTSPAFCRELAAQVRDQAAVAVRETRLPYAFYGLTYLPLILSFTVAAGMLQSRGNKLFARPLWMVANGLPFLLLTVSFTHASAVLPVALVLCPTFLFQAWWFRQRWSLIPASAAFLAIALGIPGFCERVLLVSVSREFAILLWSVFAGLLFVPGALLDVWSSKWNRPEEEADKNPFTENICQTASLIAALCAGVVWTVACSSAASPFALAVAVVIGLLLAGHTLRWLHPGIGEATLIFATYAGLRAVIPLGAVWSTQFELLVYLLLAQWVAALGLERFRHNRFALAFWKPARNVGSAGLGLLFAGCIGFWIVAHAGFGGISLLTSCLLLLWGLDASRRFDHPIFAGVVWCAVFLFGSAAVAELCGPANSAAWWLAIWAAIGAALLMLQSILRGLLNLDDDFSFQTTSDVPPPSHETWQQWLRPLDAIIPAVWLGIAIVSLPILHWPQQIAALVSLCGLVVLIRKQRIAVYVDLLWPLINWHLLAAFVTFAVGTPKWLHDVSVAEIASFGLSLAALAGLSAWITELGCTRLRFYTRDGARLHQAMLIVLAGLLLAGAVAWHMHQPWSAADLACVLTAWVAVTAMFWAQAAAEKEPLLVWCGLGVLLAATGYAFLIDAITLTDPALAALILIAGLSLWSIGQAVKSSERLQVFSTPFRQVGFWLPALVAPVAFGRHVADLDVLWVGSSSLLLLFTSGFYFWRGISDRNLGSMVMSAAILNLAAGLLWTELHWTDPQLFLMPVGISILVVTELMQREIPGNMHRELRFIGALTILVSPTFHIVTGSWLHIATLMIAAVALALLSIGLRVRVLLYTSSAFLLADLIALVARGSVDHPNLLWVVGVLLGTSVTALGAVCENHRETVLARIRAIGAMLDEWQ